MTTLVGSQVEDLIIDALLNAEGLITLSPNTTITLPSSTTPLGSVIPLTFVPSTDSNSLTTIITPSSYNGKLILSGASSLSSIDFLGGSGNDTITGGTIADTLKGAAGNDEITGNEGNDILSGLTGSDTLYGGFGNDLVQGGTDADTLFGDLGADTLVGNQGNDILWGESSTATGGTADLLRGGKGNDTILGGIGADTLNGNLGNDSMTGGIGTDRFMFNQDGTGNDTITDFQAGTDKIFIVSTINDLDIETGDVLSLLSEIDGNTIVNLGGDNIITLVGIALNTITTSDFNIL